MRDIVQEAGRAPLAEGMRAIRPAARTAFIFGLFINLLLFVSPLYMLQIYDRAIPSRSGITLAGLTVIALYLTVVYAALDMLRGRLMIRAGRLFDEKVAQPVFNALHRSQLAEPGGDRTRALRDVDSVREVVSGQGLIAVTDIPAIPIFVIVCFLLHPWFGVLSILAVLILVGLTALNETTTRTHLKAAHRASSRASASADAALRNGEVLRAMNMLGPIRDNWLKLHREAIDQSVAASDKGGRIGSATKFVRLAIQTAVLGSGAYLAIQREISPGAIIAASIIVGRVVGPAELLIGNWKGFIAARDAWERLTGLMDAHGRPPACLPLPTPKGHVEFDGVAVAPPGARAPVLQRLTFAIQPGETLAVLGPSASGKSSLARILCGVWQPVAGTVRLDGAELRHWDPEKLGEHIGYLPQDVELFSGTVAQNISRFGEARSEDIIAIAKLAGCHDMIQALPDGYNTEIGEGGANLSGGQRQRIGLARAFFGMPPLVVLDEPNANLDGEGETILVEALHRFRNAGRTIVLITHRPSVLASVDKVMVLAEGQMRLFGPRDEVLGRLQPAVAA
jgi:ATP-binding cassette subfamily C protein